MPASSKPWPASHRHYFSLISSIKKLPHDCIKGREQELLGCWGNTIFCLPANPLCQSSLLATRCPFVPFFPPFIEPIYSLLNEDSLNFQFYFFTDFKIYYTWTMSVICIRRRCGCRRFDNLQSKRQVPLFPDTFLCTLIHNVQ